MPDLTNNSITKIRLDRATADALERYELGMDEPFPFHVDIEIVGNSHFGARVFETGNSYTIEVNSAVLSGIDQLWKQALQSTVLINDAGNRVNDIDGSELTLERLAHLSLTWLVLHELMHIRLGHLELLDSAQLVETDNEESADGFWQRNQIADIANVLSSKERKLFRPCLELQADNEATEVMFGIFAESEWGRFRIGVRIFLHILCQLIKVNLARTVIARRLGLNLLAPARQAGNANAETLRSPSKGQPFLLANRKNMAAKLN